MVYSNYILIRVLTNYAKMLMLFPVDIPIACKGTINVLDIKIKDTC